MIRLRGVAVFLVCLPAFVGCHGQAGLTQGPRRQDLGRSLSGDRGISEDRGVREHGGIRPLQGDTLHAAARWAVRQDGMESAATGSPPRFLGKLQNRDRRVRARQAPEDGHGAALGGAADPGRQRCSPIVGGERRRREGHRRRHCRQRESLGNPAGADDDVRQPDWQSQREISETCSAMRRGTSYCSIIHAPLQPAASFRTKVSRIDERLLDEDRGPDARASSTRRSSHGSTKTRSKLSSTAATK